ncbi:MAG: hypothetical protein HWN67_02810 [Candidatus Helarchaeota archaeon]|nr:hypothetical protein [Candidatus Helarchaeota archaeon]
MHFGLVGISFLFKLKFRKVPIGLIILFLFIPEFIYLILLILQWYFLSQFPPILSPSPIHWSHSIITNGVISGIAMAIIIIKKYDKSNLILGILPIVNILSNTYSIFYSVHYFYPFFVDINTLFIEVHVEFQKYLKTAWGNYIGFMMILWPYETIYWSIDLLTLFFCIIISLWRLVKTEFEEKIIIKIDDGSIIPPDYSLIHNYPRVEEISIDETRIFTQEEWEKTGRAIRDQVGYYRFIKGEKINFEYKYPDFGGYVSKIEKPKFASYEKKIKNIYYQLNYDEDFENKEVYVHKLKIPLIENGKLFLIQEREYNKVLQRELLYISQEGIPIFLNRGKDYFLEFDYKKFNLILKYEKLGLKSIIEFNYDSRSETTKQRINLQILKIVKLFIMLFGCFRERILYTREEIERWKAYDYKNPDREYKIDMLPINLIEIYKLKNSIGINFWTWADYYSKWALFFYQFQLFPDGFHPKLFRLYRIPVYTGATSLDEKLR